MYVTALTGWLAGNLTVFSKNYIKTSPYIPGLLFYLLIYDMLLISGVAGFSQDMP